MWEEEKRGGGRGEGLRRVKGQGSLVLLLIAFPNRQGHVKRKWESSNRLYIWNQVTGTEKLSFFMCRILLAV